MQVFHKGRVQGVVKKTMPWAKCILLLIITLLCISSAVYAQSSQVYNTPGSSTFTVPSGVTQITVGVWGGGGKGGTFSGGGSSGGGGGGGGGGYSRSVISVTPGDILNLNVGAGSTTTAAGGQSWFINTSTLRANGGLSVGGNVVTGGSGGALGVGTVRYVGGNGANGSGTTYGGGGGSSAGTGAAGINATNQNGATAPTGGGSGGNGRSGSQGPGVVGSVPGGGGGGGLKTANQNTTQDGGNGANGRVRVAWSPPNATNSTIAANPTSGVAANGSDSSTMTITVRNGNNAVMGAGVNLFFEITSGTGTLSSGPWTSNASGQATATVTSTTAGTVVVTGYLGTNNSGAILGTASVDFVPEAPVAQAATNIDFESFTANWTASTSSGVTEYRLDVSEASDFSTFVSGYENLNVGTAVLKSVTGLDHETTYYYRVRAIASTGASANSNSIDLTTSALPPDATASTIGASPTTGVTADGSDSSTLTITVRDESNNVIQNEDVFFAITGGSGGSLSSDPWSSNASGEATATLTSTVANTITVTGYLGTNSSGDVLGTATVEFDSGPATQIAALSLGISTIGVNGSTTVTATIEDVNGNPVEGVTVSFSSDEPTRATVAATASTNSSGEATANVTGSNDQAGNVVITASIDDADSNVAISDSDTVNLSVEAGAADATASTIAASPATGVTADGSDSSTLTITVRDASNNLLENEDVFFAITGGSGGTLSAGPWSSDVNGQATATITSLDANTITVTGYLGTNSSSGELGTATVAFEAGTATNIAINAGNNQSAEVNTAVSIAPSVLVTDTNSNPVSGINVTFSVATGGGTVNPTTAITTNSNGVAQLTSWTLGSTTGTNTIEAVSAGLTGSPVTFTATATSGSGDAANSTIQSSPSTGVAGDQSESSTITITVRDGSNNLVSNEDVFFDITSGSGGALSVGPWSSNGSGEATATLTSSIVNTITVTGYLGTDTNGSILGTATVEFIPGDASQLSFQQQPSGTQADQTIVPSPTVRILDATGNLVSSDNTTQVSIDIDSNPSSGTLSGTKTVTASGGVATFSGLSIDEVGSGYSLYVTATGLTTDESNQFEIFGANQEIFSIPGSSSFTVPDGVIEITVEVWGGGGRGGEVSGSGSNTAGGGGGGAYSSSVITGLTPGQDIDLQVGGGSTTSAAGGDSWFSIATTLLAKGGASVGVNTAAAGVGGLASAGIGDTKYSGGTGANGIASDGGGGGSSAGSSSNGTNATGQAGATAPADGGDGGDGRSTTTGVGVVGSAPGGGGGGALKTGGGPATYIGGAGANGQVLVSWSPPFASNSTIEANPESGILGDNTEESTLTITVRNGTNNVMGAGVDLFFKITSGTGTLSTGPWTSAANGQATATLTSGIGGTVTVTGYLGTDDTGEVLGTADVIFDGPYYSRQTGNWDVAANWSRDSHTGVASATTPSAEDEIIIGNSHTITLNFSPFTLTNPGTVTVSDTGVLVFTGENRISGTGTFVLESGGRLKIGSVNGITTNSDAGNIRTDTRTYNDGANFTYEGSSAQVTGDALPQQLNHLEITNPTTVRASSSHQVSGTLTLANGALVMGDGLSLIANTKNITSGELQYELEVSGQAGYRLLSSPLNVDFDNFLSEVITQGFTGASLTDTEPLQPNVLFYDETFEGTDNRRWRAPNNITDSVVSGRGYHVFMFGAVTEDSRYNDALPYTLFVNGQENEGTAGEVDMNVTYTEAGDTGWNLVGNPFGATIDWEDNASWTKTNIDPTLYVWDPNTNNYLTWNGSAGDITDGLVAPFQGFWIKANAANPELKVTRDAKTISAGAGFVGKEVSKSVKEPVPVVSLQVKHSQHLQSTAHLSFTSEGRLGMDSFDSFRLLPPPDIDSYVEFYSSVEKERLSVNNLPRRFGRVIEIPLEVNAYNEDGAISEDMWLKVTGYQNIPDGWEMEIFIERTGEKFAIIPGDSIRVSMAHMSGKNVTRTNEMASVTTMGGDAHAQFTLRIAPGADALGITNEFRFHPNYPNPFNPTTTLAFELPIPGAVRLEVYDLIGRRVAVLVNENLTAGSHSVSWDARGMSSGIYIARLVTADGMFTRKLTMIK